MRTLTQNEISELNNVLSEFGPALFGTNDINVNLLLTNNKIVITISEVDYKTKFEEYLKSLDDDIFIDACAQYTKKTGQDLSKVKEITPQLINNFKNIVRLVAQMKIDSIKNKYFV